jgi:hypothetical protein
LTRFPGCHPPAARGALEASLRPAHRPSAQGPNGPPVQSRTPRLVRQAKIGAQVSSSRPTIADPSPRRNESEVHRSNLSAHPTLHSLPFRLMSGWSWSCLPPVPRQKQNDGPGYSGDLGRPTLLACCAQESGIRPDWSSGDTPTGPGSARF